MILAKSEIETSLAAGTIVIAPFDKKQMNPNSYNLRLGNKLLVYHEPVLDPKRHNEHSIFEIPESGYALEPGRLYLGETVEYTETHRHVPMIEGRSSLGRLGLFVHITAGFGDVGFCGKWTLEMSCIHPIRVYPDMQVCQIFFHTLMGKAEPYASKYQNNTGVQPSLMFKDYE